MNKYGSLFRDSAYDHRKVLNSEELIRIANDMGYTHEALAEICEISKTMISHWGNTNKSSKPTYKQLEPMFKKLGRGRFKYKLEPLPPAAVEYKEIHQYLAILMLLGLFFIALWFVSWKPCVNNWEECKKLPWYKMGSYEMINATQAIKEFKEWKRNVDKPDSN